MYYNWGPLEGRGDVNRQKVHLRRRWKLRVRLNSSWGDQGRSQNSNQSYSLHPARCHSGQWAGVWSHHPKGDFSYMGDWSFLWNLRSHVHSCKYPDSELERSQSTYIIFDGSLSSPQTCTWMGNVGILCLLTSSCNKDVAMRIFLCPTSKVSFNTLTR